MEKLKILNLSHSHYLTQTPDFSNLPNLEKLVLADCPRLSEVSPSIGNLSEILLIDLEDCVSLRSLPRSIYKLKSLKTLILSGCLLIDNLEENLEHMESSTTLLANNTAINRLPSPFQTSTFTSSPVHIPLDIPHSSSQELSLISMYISSPRSLWVECNSEHQLSHDATIILDALHAKNSKELEQTATTSQVSRNSVKCIFIQLGLNDQFANFLKEKVLQVSLIFPCTYFIVNIVCVTCVRSPIFDENVSVKQHLSLQDPYTQCLKVLGEHVVSNPRVWFLLPQCDDPLSFRFPL